MRDICRLLVLAITVLVMHGCAVLPGASGAGDSTGPAATGDLPQGESWWYARFHIPFPDEDTVDWHIGTLLAGEVIAPIFDTHYSNIRIWRIHRRAARDRHGHIFSFIFYSTARGAQDIFNEIDRHPVVSQLRNDGRLTRVSYDDVSKLRRRGIADTSDRNWPQVIQDTWPAMIMGASRMWLDMVTVVAAGQMDEPDLEQRYRAVNDEITRLWAEEGQHAILHHLSALYGYKPLMIRY